MSAYLAHIKMNMRLTFRDRTVVFFNYLFPLIFFFMFAQLYHAEQGGAINQVVNMVLTIGILGSGFFGAGIRAVMDREQNILRRFKVAPISAGPIIVSSLVTGWILYMPMVVVVLVLSHFLYGMQVPERLGSLLLFISAGVIAFRAIGMMIASVVNSMQESQIVVQLLYFPMLMLSGATIPTNIMPNWVQIASGFLPATYLVTGLQGILTGKESILQNLPSVGALLATTAVAVLLSMKLFRWEKEEKLKGSAKFWLLAVLGPFVLMGIWEGYTKDNISKNKVLGRDMRRSRTLLIRDVRILTGDGEVIESGGVLIRNGRIEEIYHGAVPEPKSLKAEAIDGSGKTLMPGLVDTHVHLASPGGILPKPEDYQPQKTMPRALASYLFSGVTAVRSAGDPTDGVLGQRALIDSGEALGAELFVSGPMFTTPGGHGTEYTKQLPESIRQTADAQLVRLPKNADEARQMVRDLKAKKVDAIKAILETGVAGMLYNRMDIAILRAIADEAAKQGLPLSTHTGNAQDVADAIEAGTRTIEHGSMRDAIPDASFELMKQKGIAYDPTLSVAEAFLMIGEGKMDLLERTLVQQVGPPQLLTATKKWMISPEAKKMAEVFLRIGAIQLETARKNLKRAWELGVPLITGSDAGNLLVIHGPTIHREMQLWVSSGIPPAAAIQAATYNAAKALGAENRFGRIRKGMEATFVLVDGDPLKDISVTERVSLVMFKGERVNRSELFEQE